MKKKAVLIIRSARVILFLVRGWSMKDKDLLKLLKKNGWNVVRINGSHHVLQKDGITTVVPIHGKDIPVGLLNSILKETGLK